MVIIEMENGKKIKIALDPTAAPITVGNFEKLVKAGFYDGLIFHRDGRYRPHEHAEKAEQLRARNHGEQGKERVQADSRTDKARFDELP